MRRLLQRIPRESRAAAVVLGAALVLVGLLAVLGLSGEERRRQAAESELVDRTDRVVQGIAAAVARDLGDAVARLETELARPALPPERRAGAAVLESGVPAFRDAYLLDSRGGLHDWRLLPPRAEPGFAADPAARERLDEIRRLEADDPARAAEAAERLADELASDPAHDQQAAGLALLSGARAAFRHGDHERARRLSLRVLEDYPTVRDDRGLRGSGEPLAWPAGALLCEVLREALLSAPPGADAAFADALLERRRRAQRLRSLLSAEAYAFERDACARLHRETAGRIRVEHRRRLDAGLATADATDGARDRVAAHPREALLAMARGTGSTLRPLEDGGLLCVVPLREAEGGSDSPAGGAVDAVAVVFLAEADALRRDVLAPALAEAVPPEGVALRLEDGAGAPVLGDARGPAIGHRAGLGQGLPGLFAAAVLADPEVLEREAEGARRRWLSVLLGAGLAVGAASLLAVRAVLREVRLARLKSDFVSNLSHELRTPLTSLRMFVETLQEGRVRDPAEARECLDVVAQETNRLTALVDRILAFASYARGRAPIALRSADAGEVAERAVALFRARAERSGARLELDVAPELPESILDREALVQVLLNLLDNAVKYGGEKGAVVRVSVRPVGREVAIDVEDDGPGVPERERELVFEEFYRGDESLSGRVQGTGIGLALARRIVLAHGGRIDCLTSRALGGALFRVLLPDAESGRRRALAAAAGGP